LKLSAVTVASGALDTVNSGGSVSGATVQSGGLLVLLPGSVESAVTVSSGGTVEPSTLLSGLSAGVVTSSATISGITLLSGAMVEYDAISLSSGQTLSLGSGGTLHNITISSGATLSGGGVLSGYNTVDGSLNGQSIEFGTTNLSGTANGVTVGLGGSLIASSGATVNDAVVANGGELDVDFGGSPTGTTVQSGGYVFLDGQPIVARTVYSVRAGDLASFARTQQTIRHGTPPLSARNVLGVQKCRAAVEVETGGKRRGRTILRDLTIRSGGSASRRPKFKLARIREHRRPPASACLLQPRLGAASMQARP
jgi:autotransporter passenger strand-loop-strand repeat protein